MLLDISAHYPWAMGVLLGDVHPSEQERLNNLVPQQGLKGKRHNKNGKRHKKKGKRHKKKGKRHEKKMLQKEKKS